MIMPFDCLYLSDIFCPFPAAALFSLTQSRARIENMSEKAVFSNTVWTGRTDNSHLWKAQN